MAAFGTAIAEEEAGDVAFNKTIVEVEEEVAEAVVGATFVTGQEVDEWVKDDKFGIGVVDGFEEVGEVVWEGEGTVAAGTRFLELVGDV